MPTLPGVKIDKILKADSLRAQLQAKLVNPSSLFVFFVLLIISVVIAALLDKQVPDTFIVAELSANHGGSLETALKLVHAASACWRT